MSFILDALKKSEHERQRQAIPGLVESGTVRLRPRLPLWAIALCVLLGINLVVLLAVLTHGWMTVSPSGATTAHSTPRMADDPREADKHFSPLDSSPVYAPEVPVNAVPQPPVLASVPASRQAAGNGAAGNGAAGNGASVHSSRRRDPLLNDGDYKADEEETLPSFSELNLTGAQALPDLHLDVHVFATNSAERFVFINMRKYHEGSTLQEGPTVERIRRDGVILTYDGLRFLLPRQ